MEYGANVIWLLARFGTFSLSNSKFSFYPKPLSWNNVNQFLEILSFFSTNSFNLDLNW